MADSNGPGTSLGLQARKSGSNDVRNYTSLNSNGPPENQEDPTRSKASDAMMRSRPEEDPTRSRGSDAMMRSRSEEDPTRSRGSDAMIRSRSSGRSSMTSAERNRVSSMGDKEYNLMLAGAKLIGGLHCIKAGRLGIETGSVYGAAILVPQLARTLGWPRLLTASAVKVYGFLILCIAVHGGLLTLLAKEESVVDAFAGQPYLCDFGALCIDTPENCIGPGGTRMTPERLFGYSEWVTRNFVRDSMRVIFPDKVGDIDKHIDPGEYGAETYYGRWLCCFIFITALDPELDLAVSLAWLLWHCSSDPLPWVQIRDGNAPGDGDGSEQSCLWWLDHVRVKIGGMTWSWKIFNFLLVLSPKILLWILTCLAGINFLMETAGIDDVIINACALGFLLSLDNMILESFASAEVKCLMERCEDLYIYSGVGSFYSGAFEEDDIVHTYHFEEQLGLYWTSLVYNIMPWKFLRVVSLTILFVVRYYHAHCEPQEGNRNFYLVSKPVALPLSSQFTFLNTFSVFFPIPLESTPYWTMPEA